MPRPLRVEFENACYHIMSRGIGQRDIFTTDDQREYFLDLLSNTTRRFKAEWHAYCLMDDHYHLMLKTPLGNLHRIMRQINGVYTQYYNRSEGQDGSVFRGRFKAVLVDHDSYWLGLSRYIHHIPVQLGTVKRLDRHPWSSYPAYIGKRKPPGWLHTHDVLRAIGRRDLPRRYKAYAEEGCDEELLGFYGKKKLSPILGDADFRDRVKRAKRPSPEALERKRIRTLPSINKIVKAAAARLKIDPKRIHDNRRGRGNQNDLRPMVFYICQEHCGMKLQEIADRFELSGYGSSGSLIRVFRQRLDVEPKLLKMKDLIVRDLKL